MADTKGSNLTELTSVISGDKLFAIDDPGGTPITKNITVDNFFGDIPVDVSLTGTASLDIADITDGNIPYMSASGFADSPISADGNVVSINRSLSAGRALYVGAYPENSTYRAIGIDAEPTVTSTGTYYFMGNDIGVEPKMDSAVTNSGYMMAQNFSMLARDTMDGATLNELYGMRFQFGISSGTGTINTVFGADFQPFYQSGTIGDIYALRIKTPATGGTITGDKYSIYSAWDAPWYKANPTEALQISDAGSTGATEQDWIEVEVGGNTGYIRVYASK